jgi:hypothetical protein
MPNNLRDEVTFAGQTNELQKQYDAWLKGNTLFRDLYVHNNSA